MIPRFVTAALFGALLSLSTHCASPPLDPEDPNLLARPFTPQQIASALTVGTVMDIEEGTPMGKQTVRWKVTEADDAECVITFTVLDGRGQPTAARHQQRFGWAELRNHASYPAASSTVQDDRRLTPLGVLEGRLYTITDAEKGLVTRAFFAPAYPGPPLWMEVKNGAATVATMQVLAKRQG